LGARSQLSLLARSTSAGVAAAAATPSGSKRSAAGGASSSVAFSSWATSSRSCVRSPIARRASRAASAITLSSCLASARRSGNAGAAERAEGPARENPIGRRYRFVLGHRRERARQARAIPFREAQTADQPLGDRVGAIGLGDDARHGAPPHGPDADQSARGRAVTGEGAGDEEGDRRRIAGLLERPRREPEPALERPAQRRDRRTGRGALLLERVGGGTPHVLVLVLEQRQQWARGRCAKGNELFDLASLARADAQ
jgi:hypothetical protein